MPHVRLLKQALFRFCRESQPTPAITTKQPKLAPNLQRYAITIADGIVFFLGVIHVLLASAVAAETQFLFFFFTLLSI